ncbi:hypothetical protein Ancab_007820 [Ancistrocladus abbreviatus]
MTLVLLQSSPVRLLPANISIHATTPLSLHARHVLYPRIFNSELCYRGLFKRFCSKNENIQKIFEGFSVLESDIPWESGSVWSTMAFYFFSLHVPFSFGGLSFFAQVLHRPNIEPEAKVLSILVIQTLELFSALLLLQFTSKPHYKLASFFKPHKLPSERNWLVAAALGFLFLIFVIFFTSFLADRIAGSKV